MDAVSIISLVAGAGGFAAIGGLVWVAMRGDPEREAEERARLYYDRYGRWPED